MPSQATPRRLPIATVKNCKGSETQNAFGTRNILLVEQLHREREYVVLLVRIATEVLVLGGGRSPSHWPRLPRRKFSIRQAGRGALGEAERTNRAANRHVQLNGPFVDMILTKQSQATSGTPLRTLFRNVF